MTQLRITKHSKKYGFKKDEIYDVTPKSNMDYLVIMPDNRPNIVLNDKTLKRYGVLETKKV